MALVVGDLRCVPLARRGDHFQVAQHRLGYAAVGFLRHRHLDLAHQFQQRLVEQELIVEVAALHPTVQQGNGGGVGHGVVGCLAVGRAPLLRVAGHDVHRRLERGDVDLGHRVGRDAARRLLPHVEGCLRDCLGILAQREALDAALGNLEGLAVPAHRPQLDGSPGHGIEIPACPLVHRRRAGNAALGQLHREHGVAGGVGVGAALPHRNVADASLVQGDVGRHVEIEGLQRLLRRQVHSPRRSKGAGRAAYGYVIEPGLDVHRVAQAAEDLVGQHGGEDEGLAVRARRLGGRQRCRDAVAGVARLVAGVAVVEVQVSDGNPVSEGGQVQAGLLPAPHNGHGMGAGH